MTRPLLAVLALAAGALAPAYAADPTPAAAPAKAEAPKSGKLEDVVIKAKEEEEPSAGKPPLELVYDPYESLRPTLKPDESLLLAESPALSAWVRSRPERLRAEHLLQPWNDALDELADIRLPIRAQLSAAFGGRGPSPSELKALSWNLSLVDEEGKPIRKFEGGGAPPEELVWDGTEDNGDRLRAGHAYSAVYKFWTSTSTVRTGLGQPIQFAGLVYKEPKGAASLIGLDSAALFGTDRKDKDVSAAGKSLLKAAADWVRRKSWGSPIALRAYGPDQALAAAQGAAAKSFLAGELGLPPERIPLESFAASASDQRLEVRVGD